MNDSSVFKAHKSWKILAVTYLGSLAVVSLIFGMATIFWQNPSYDTVAIAVGIYALVRAVISLVTFFRLQREEQKTLMYTLILLSGLVLILGLILVITSRIISFEILYYGLFALLVFFGLQEGMLSYYLLQYSPLKINRFDVYLKSLIRDFFIMCCIYVVSLFVLFLYQGSNAHMFLGIMGTSAIVIGVFSAISSLTNGRNEKYII